MVLLEQSLTTSEGSIDLKSWLQEEGKKLGVGSLAITNFIRWEAGQGIEKRQVDFAQEVAAQVRQARSKKEAATPK